MTHRCLALGLRKIGTHFPKFRRPFDQTALALFSFLDRCAAIAEDVDLTIVRVVYGRENCAGFAAMQAWAQNLGHDSLTTTFGSYGKVAPSEQGKLVRGVKPRAA